VRNRGDHVFHVDARPSDSIALALRLHAPIFAADQLFEDAAIETGEALPERSMDAESLKQYLEKLDPQDFGKFNP